MLNRLFSYFNVFNNYISNFNIVKVHFLFPNIIITDLTINPVFFFYIRNIDKWEF